MVITETVMIKECPYYHTYSDKELFICKKSDPSHIYTHKYDEMDAELDYIESNIPIPQKEWTAEEALKIITGGE